MVVALVLVFILVLCKPRTLSFTGPDIGFVLGIGFRLVSVLDCIVHLRKDLQKDGNLGGWMENFYYIDWSNFSSQKYLLKSV